MKKSLYFLFILALFCLTGCKDALVPKPIKLTCNINTFDAPISCISRSTADADKLYIGQEDGCIIEKVNNNCQTYSINSNRRIYDILEYSEDSLFVGTRDAGLKLLAKSSRQTQTYYIKNKRMNYSVYSMALDDDKQCLYVGTSNGLFRLNLKDGSTSHELTPIQLGKCSKNCGVNKVVIKEKKLYVASEQGLFVVRNLEKDFKRPVIDSLVTNVSVYNDTVYALLENSVFKISPDGKKTLVRKGRCYLYAQGPDKDEWFISANSILYVKDGCTLEYDLPNGISTIARQIGFMGKDFLHLACREAMLSFALRQNSADLDNNVLAVSDKRTGDSIFFITDDLRLHLYKFVYNHPEFKSKSLGKIEGLDIVGNDIIKFLETSPNTFFLATRKKLYKIKGNRAECLLQFSQLFDEKLIISFSLSVTFRITIPRRKIDSEFQSILVTSFAEFLYHIPFSVFPWRRSNRMLGCPGRPQAETIMMLGSNDSHFEATFLQSSYPLFTIQFGRIENGRIFFTISPFTACKGINTKMKETSEFHLLPCQLLRCRHQTGSHIYLLFRSRSCRKSYVFLIILLCLSSQKSTK